MADTDYFGKDKLMHFGACFLITLLHPYLSIGASIGKEYGDYRNPNSHWCWYDLIADALGIASGYAIWYYVILPLTT